MDVTYRYQPLGSTLYQGFTLGGELFGNSERVERESGFRRMFAPGGYVYGEAKINREWAAGFLYDNAPSLNSPGKKTIGYSPFLTWNLSEFNRLRVGIGRPGSSRVTVNHVLATFKPGERELAAASVATAADAVEVWLRDGIEAAMNEFNGLDLAAPIT